MKKLSEWVEEVSQYGKQFVDHPYPLSHYTFNR
jgi:hypothetical protein